MSRHAREGMANGSDDGPDGGLPSLSLEWADRLARIALGHVGRETPFALHHVMAFEGDLATPKVLHPIFHGSFDWHSCVHSYWLLARLLRRFPGLAAGPAIRARFEDAFTEEKGAGELNYFRRPASRGFERPYGWAWCLKLCAELVQHPHAGAKVWSNAIGPLGALLATRLDDFLDKAAWPTRSGMHSNTAFALVLANDYAAALDDGPLAAKIRETALRWYGKDQACQAWEPSSEDFLSPALLEGELMRRLLPPEDFRRWFSRFLPNAAAAQPASLFAPVSVADRSDGKLAHLDGLNLSRAWCWRGLAAAFAPEDPVRALSLETAGRHLAASLPHLDDDYMGGHWLATFALMALGGV